MGVPRYTRLQGRTGLGQRELKGNLVANALLTILSHLLASSTLSQADRPADTHFARLLSLSLFREPSSSPTRLAAPPS